MWRRNARIASAVLATAIPSVCLSVRPSVRLSATRRYCVKSTARSTVQFALSDSKMCLVLNTPKRFSRDDHFPLKSWFQVSYPLPKTASFDTFCLVAPRPQEIEKEDQLHLTRTRHGLSNEPRFYAASNFLKMGIKYLNFSSFGQFPQ